MAVRLIDSLATTEALAEIFSDISLLQAMLDFEIALARVEARLGIIPLAAAKAIAKTQVGDFDSATLAKASLRAGTPGIPFSKALTEVVRVVDAKSAGFVHWGATSQDVADTAMVLLLKNAKPVIESDLLRTEAALHKLTEEYSETVMLGRTLLQPAPPVTFGLKAAGWLASIRRGRQRFAAAMDESLQLQLGGASGTLAALGEKGAEVARRVAEELGLKCPNAPWHAQRDQLAAAICACGVLTGSLAKMAKDVSLMMQGEVREIAEAGGDGRGGSSTMPQKQNPVGCALVLAAATRVPGVVSAFLSGMVQEHERAVGGWQAECSTIANIVQALGLAAESSAEIAEGLTVDVARMRNNLDDTLGTVLAEKVMIFLGRKIGRDKAHHLLEEAARTAITEKQPLAIILAGMPEVTKHMDASALEKVAAPGDYLGSAEIFLRQQLDSKD